jgi:Recombination endonuclease VII
MAQIAVETKLEKTRAYSRERMRARRAADPEGEREYMRAWRAANPKRVKAHHRAWKIANEEIYKERRQESARQWRAKNPDKIREAKRRCYKANPETYKLQVRRSLLKRKYGLTLEQYDDLFAKQGHCCAVCKATEPGSSKGWHLDHCHETGYLRGILCNHCNLMLGYAKDSKTTLANAIKYLCEASGPQR